ncbi:MULTISPECIES: hypothetical protein [unclassified Streptomyces]|uniref:hypothetical protein n=1 Tax=unclassified Streptomyces TaxID=2593676 RepID=UPI000DB93D29|nr:MULTISPECIES: hypothetical protein [unclassified Streptomyces]MYT68698.1 hypothetical protein [Streptomyces sp. SID8367]RAJ86371.1 hypothetical protein K377_03219 [Streptomyces sp. PsTaAH-137]
MTNPLAGLFKARQRDAARSALYAGSVHRCGAYLAEQGAPAPLIPRQTRLTQAIGTLTAAVDGPAADPFDALLGVGERALETGGDASAELALSVAGTATRLRQRSRAAWRLHGAALDGLGRDAEALESYERYLTLVPDGEGAPGTVRRIDTLRQRRAVLAELADLVGDETEETAALRAALSSPAAAPSALTPQVADLVRRRTVRDGAGDPAVRRLAELYGTYRRLVERDAVPDALPDAVTPVGVAGLRALLDGKSVGVVASTDAGAGAVLDGYDVVVRCDGFRGGARTDLHAVTPRGATPWDGPPWTAPTGIRLVFDEAAPRWRRIVRQRLVPGAQEHIGDVSLRRPLTDPALLGEPAWGEEASTAFTVLRLLDFLDVTPRLDLIGFPASGAGALRPAEAAWVADHSTQRDDSTMRTALR